MQTIRLILPDQLKDHKLLQHPRPKPQKPQIQTKVIMLKKQQKARKTKNKPQLRKVKRLLLRTKKKRKSNPNKKFQSKIKKMKSKHLRRK
jgi:hypothetical protein